MFDQKKVKDLVLTTLVADSYSLGAHWIYDEKQLAQISNWDDLIAPVAIWHKGKGAGEFTHYGDQTYWLYEFLKDKEEFDDKEFLTYWQNKMKLYEGYIDGATRNTIENIENDVTPSGSESSDLSVVGRIVPLLMVSKDKKEFLSNVEKFVKLTHNSQKALRAAMFFAKFLVLRFEGKKIEEALEILKESSDTAIQAFVQKGIESKASDTFEVIRDFGPACDVDEGFGGIIHLLSKYDNLKNMLVYNSKAGGDNSARAMIASAIFMVDKPLSQIPQNWLGIKVTI